MPWPAPLAGMMVKDDDVLPEVQCRRGDTDPVTRIVLGFLFALASALAGMMVKDDDVLPEVQFRRGDTDPVTRIVLGFLFALASALAGPRRPGRQRVR